MQLLTLTDTKLAMFHRQAAAEIARRAKAATSDHDSATIVFGNEMAKRALMIAVAGGHSIQFVGSPNCGKTMLRAAALELGLGGTFEARPCPCGYCNDPRVACRCTARQVENHIRKLALADITVEMRSPTQREMGVCGTTLTDMRRQIDGKSSHDSTDLEDHGRHLLNASVAELGLDIDVRMRIIAIARTIANLERCERISPIHICEAINYRAFRR